MYTHSNCFRPRPISQLVPILGSSSEVNAITRGAMNHHQIMGKDFTPSSEEKHVVDVKRIKVQFILMLVNESLKLELQYLRGSQVWSTI